MALKERNFILNVKIEGLKMQKSKIEWCDYVANPVKGVCQDQCPYCYAKRMYKRFKWNPEKGWNL